MISGQKIAVVIPAYRVAGQIGRVIRRMPAEVDRIFVVDDASPDNVLEILKAVQDPRLTLLRHSSNRGVGAATITGVRAAMDDNADIVAKCDGDAQMDPRNITLLVSPIIENIADHVKGTRFRHFEALSSMPKWRFMGNVVLTFLTKLASGYWNVMDPVNGFLATSTKMLKRLPLSKLSPRYCFETDLLIRLNTLEARVAEVAFPARYGNELSSLRVTEALLRFPPCLLIGFFRRVFWRYLFHDVSPVAIFGLAGTFLVLFGTVFGCYYWIKNASASIPTATGTVMIAALSIILGFQLLIQSIVLDIQNTPKAGSRRWSENSEGNSF